MIIFEIDIVATLSFLQTQLNNLFNASRELSSNDIIYEFKTRKAISLLNFDNSITINIQSFRLKYKVEATNVIFLRTWKWKFIIMFDILRFYLNQADKIFLRLHKKYKLTHQSQNNKLFNQKCDSFLVKRRVERFAYKLDLSSAWRVHSAISMTQLKSALKTDDLYERFRSDYSESMHVKKNTKFEKFYVVEKILAKKSRKVEKTTVI